MIRKLVLIFGILFLLIGLILSLQKPIMTYLVANMSKEAIQNPKVEQPTVSPDSTFDFTKVKNVQLRDVLAAQTEKKNVKPIGAISVPDVQMQLPIVYGISNVNLTIGAGTMKRDQIMGKGNYALAAHNMNDNKTLFSPLAEAKKGMNVYITDFKNVYEYKISDIFIVEPTQVEVIDDKANQKLITLVTCNNDGSKRVIIRGALLKTFAYSDNSSFFKIS
ncbi:class A sortase [Rummeliibacillus sp. JY-2-4R]